MKDNAKLMMDKLDSRVLGNNKEKIKISRNRESEKRMGVIDKKIVFEFFSLRSMDSFESIGYVANQGQDNCKNYVSQVEDEMRKLRGF